MRTERITLSLLLTLLVVSVQAQTPRGLDAIVGQSTADRSVEATETGHSLVQFEASTDDTNATIKTGWTLSDTSTPTAGRFTTFSLAASAPLSKSGPTSLVSANGFPNAFTLSGKYTRYAIKLRNPFASPDTRRQVLDICAAVQKKAPASDAKQALIDIASKLGKSEQEAADFADRQLKKAKEDQHIKRRDELFAMAIDLGKTNAEASAFADEQVKLEAEAAAAAESFQCDTAAVEKLAPALASQFDALFWDPKAPHLFWGTSATVGKRDFEYLQADLSKASTSKTPWGVSIFGATIPGGMSTLFTGGFEHRDKFKDADEQTVCPQDAAANRLTCKTGPLGAPVDVTEELAFVEVRRFVGSRAMSLKVAYDLEAENLSVDLPIYIIPSSDSGLAGGIRVGWAETQGAQLSVFVTSAFTLFPKN